MKTPVGFVPLAGIIPGVFKCFPGALQRDPLLRVHDLGLGGRETKKRRIETIGIRRQSGGRYMVRRLQQAGRRPGLEHLLPREASNALRALLQIRPERGGRASPRKAAGHSDDRDRLEQWRGVTHAWISARRLARWMQPPSRAAGGRLPHGRAELNRRWRSANVRRACESLDSGRSRRRAPGGPVARRAAGRLAEPAASSRPW